MVVCKFFLQGNCRFGENCKFEHQINDGRQQHSSVLRQQNFNVNVNPTPQGNGNIDTNTLIRAVVNDATTAEKGGQWLLSCYAPFKEKPNFPGFEEQSFEEIRWGHYEAQHVGSLDQYKQQLQISLQTAVLKLRALQNPTAEAIHTITNIYNTPPSSGTNNNNSNFNNVFGTNQNPMFGNQSNSVFAQPNTFGNQQQNTATKSIFAAANQHLFSNALPQLNSIFTNNNQAVNPFVAPAHFAQQPNPFGQQQQSGIGGFNGTSQSSGFFNMQQNAAPSFNAHPSPFAAQQQAASPIFNTQPQNGTSPFNKNQPEASQLYATVQQNQNLFNPQQNSNPLFNPPFGIQQQNNVMYSQQQANNPFGVQGNPPANANPFGGATNMFASNAQAPVLNTNLSQSSSIFGSTQTTVINNNSDFIKDEGVYSKLEDLSEEDIKSYQSDRFEFGKIPEKPPTIEMCF